MKGFHFPLNEASRKAVIFLRKMDNLAGVGSLLSPFALSLPEMET
jgi:hypothetical protein